MGNKKRRLVKPVSFFVEFLLQIFSIASIAEIIHKLLAKEHLQQPMQPHNQAHLLLQEHIRRT